MANDTIEVGDVVRLTTDPTEMTVDSISISGLSDYYEARCVWLDTSKSVKMGKFNIGSLILIRKKNDVKS